MSEKKDEDDDTPEDFIDERYAHRRSRIVGQWPTPEGPAKKKRTKKRKTRVKKRKRRIMKSYRKRKDVKRQKKKKTHRR